MRLTTEQQSQIKAIYGKYFKESAIRYWENDKYCFMFIKFYLAKDQSELINSYWLNDCFGLEFEIDNLGGVYTLKAKSKFYTIKPIFHKYNVYDGRDVAFRQVKGDFDKILAGLDKFFDRLHKQFIEDLDNDIIPDQTYTNASFKKIGELRVIR